MLWHSHAIIVKNMAFQSITEHEKKRIRSAWRIWFFCAPQVKTRSICGYASVISLILTTSEKLQNINFTVWLDHVILTYNTQSVKLITAKARYSVKIVSLACSHSEKELDITTWTKRTWILGVSQPKSKSKIWNPCKTWFSVYHGKNSLSRLKRYKLWKKIWVISIC